MPELPDLQVISKNLESRLKGLSLSRIEFKHTKKLSHSPADFEVAYKTPIKAVRRVGKELIFSFSNDSQLSVHLMRQGEIYLDDADARHAIVIFEFSNGTTLAVCDFMKQARISLNPQFKDIPDALSKSFTEDYFWECLQSKKASTIKSILINQDLVLGIGNAYADEILWAARVAPQSKAGKIPREIANRIHKATKEVLTDAEAQIRRIAPDIVSGEIREFLKVHRKDTSETPTGHVIVNEKISGKSTYYTDEQVIY